MKTTPAQLRASNRYYEKNRGNARLPATMLSQEEAELLEEMAWALADALRDDFIPD